VSEFIPTSRSFSFPNRHYAQGWLRSRSAKLLRVMWPGSHQSPSQLQKVGEEVSLHASLQYQSYSNFWVAVRGHDSLTWDGSFARWPSFFTIRSSVVRNHVKKCPLRVADISLLVSKGEEAALVPPMSELGHLQICPGQDDMIASGSRNRASKSGISSAVAREYRARRLGDRSPTAGLQW